jgi:hypothetical protein
LGGQPQRPVRGQWFKTIEDFQKNLTEGRQLETGDILFWKEAGDWAAVAGQFAQAYAPGQVQTCVRQVLFVRPGKIVVVDQLVAPANRPLPEVQWLLQLPKPPSIEDGSLGVSNGKSWLRCRALSPAGLPPVVEATPVNTHRVSLRYHGDSSLKLIHLLEVGDGLTAEKSASAATEASGDAIKLTLGGKTFRFSSRPPFAIEEAR